MVYSRLEIYEKCHWDKSKNQALTPVQICLIMSMHPKWCNIYVRICDVCAINLKKNVKSCIYRKNKIKDAKVPNKSQNWSINVRGVCFGEPNIQITFFICLLRWWSLCCLFEKKLCGRKYLAGENFFISDRQCNDFDIHE